jgi:hypothetical protein
MVLAIEHQDAFDYPFLGHWTPESCLRKRTVPLRFVFTHPTPEIGVWLDDGEASSNRLP